MPLQTPLPSSLLIFDLDGTLIDSEADIAQSVNRALQRMRLGPLEPERIAEHIGSGVQRLIARTLHELLGREPESDLLQASVEAYLDEYDRHLLDFTRLYDGVAETLEKLAWADLAVVTNKPERFSRRILEGLGVGVRFGWILGGDSMPLRKPDPAPLIEVMRLAGAPPSLTAMIGDSLVDVQAGKSAGVVTCGIAGGFRGRQELEEAGCDFIVERFEELSRCFSPPPGTR
jgi:phosphoglycolate phosphatase